MNLKTVDTWCPVPQMKCRLLQAIFQHQKYKRINVNHNLGLVITIQNKVVNYHYIHPIHFKIHRNHINTSVYFSAVQVVSFPFYAMPSD